MLVLDQEIWNLLFGWLANRECLIPEGCKIPPEGILFYILAVIIIYISILEKEKILKGRENLLEKIRIILSTLADLK